LAAERDTALRLRAFLAGKPVLRLERRPVPVAAVDDRLLVAFVRMGGESSPWGIAWKRGNQPVNVRVVAEARRRSDVAEMAAEFGDELAAHFDPDASSLRQVWVPGVTHAEMLHFLALRYTRARQADPTVLERLNRLGRRCGQLFDSTQNPNSALCVDVTARFQELLAFPCEPIRESHLGFLMAWLGKGNRDERAAKAKAAETLAVSTSLDPMVERALATHVEAWNDAASEPARKPHAEKIRKVLDEELRRRLLLVEAAITLYSEAAPENRGTSELVIASLEELRRHDEWEEAAEEGITRSAETDHSAITSARAYAHRDADMIAARAALVPYDRASQEELIAEGSAFQGDVLSVEEVTLPPRKKRVEAVVAIDGTLPLRLRLQDTVVVAGDHEASHAWTITAIRDDAARGLRYVTLRSSSANPGGPPVRRGASGVMFHENYVPALRRQLGSRVTDTQRMAEDGEALGAWILENLARREPRDTAPDTEHFDGSTTRVSDDG
jgi:hypothetical protein